MRRKILPVIVSVLLIFSLFVSPLTAGACYVTTGSVEFSMQPKFSIDNNGVATVSVDVQGSNPGAFISVEFEKSYLSGWQKHDLGCGTIVPVKYGGNNTHFSSIFTMQLNGEGLYRAIVNYTGYDSNGVYRNEKKVLYCSHLKSNTIAFFNPIGPVVIIDSDNTKPSSSYSVYIK